MNVKEEFINIYKSSINRNGSENILQYLLSDSSDFFSAPASTKFHCSFEEGLVKHSLNVYYCLKDILERDRVKEYYGLKFSQETIAIISLLHDLCKINCYKKSFRNTKDENGNWIQMPYYEFDDNLPYGHGEKSVYLISGFMKLTREESFAIRFHMGFSDGFDPRNVNKVFELFPLALFLYEADMESTFFLEGNNSKQINIK